MQIDRTVPATVDAYISAFGPDVQAILQRIRAVVRSAAPDAEETISYRMPAFRRNGVLLYFAAFRNHIGLYPPVHGDRRRSHAMPERRATSGSLWMSRSRTTSSNGSRRSA